MQLQQIPCVTTVCHGLKVFVCVFASDGGDVRAEGECVEWCAESPPSQYGRKPERPLPAALLQHTESFGL